MRIIATAVAIILTIFPSTQQVKANPTADLIDVASQFVEYSSGNASTIPRYGAKVIAESGASSATNAISTLLDVDAKRIKPHIAIGKIVGSTIGGYAGEGAVSVFVPSIVVLCTASGVAPCLIVAAGAATTVYIASIAGEKVGEYLSKKAFDKHLYYAYSIIDGQRHDSTDKSCDVEDPITIGQFLNKEAQNISDASCKIMSSKEYSDDAAEVVVLCTEGEQIGVCHYDCPVPGIRYKFKNSTTYRMAARRTDVGISTVMKMNNEVVSSLSFKNSSSASSTTDFYLYCATK